MRDEVGEESGKSVSGYEELTIKRVRSERSLLPWSPLCGVDPDRSAGLSLSTEGGKQGGIYII